MDRERIEKLLRMAQQTVSPHEAEVAREKLREAGEWPPQMARPATPPSDAFGRSPLWAARPSPRGTRSVDEFEERLREWRHARSEFLAGRQQAMNDLFYKDFMEGFYGEAEAHTKKPRFRRSQ